MGSLTRPSLLGMCVVLSACSVGDTTGVIVDPIVFDGECQLNPNQTPDPYIDCVEKFSPAAPATFGQDRYPEVVLGPPEGAGQGMGSLDVLSLGCDGSITVFFDDPPILDGPGPDFTVFENAFLSGAVPFVEPAMVSVSADGKEWFDFPCEAETLLAPGCAGLSPVNSNTSNGVPPLDPSVSGGDVFDLAASGLSEVRFVRLTDRTRVHYEALGQGTGLYCGFAGGFDLDAIASLH